MVSEELTPRTIAEHIEALNFVSSQYLPGGPRDIKGAIRAAIKALTPPQANDEAVEAVARALKGEVGHED